MTAPQPKSAAATLATNPPPKPTVKASTKPAAPPSSASTIVDMKVAIPSTASAPAGAALPASTAHAGGAASPLKPLAGDARVPGSWDAIKPGSLVLATTGPMEGWFESLVVATRADDRFLLRWRDWPDEPEFTRRREELALLHPATDPQG